MKERRGRERERGREKGIMDKKRGEIGRGKERKEGREKGGERH